METILPENIYCVKLTDVDVTNDKVARLTLMTAPGHGAYARRFIEAKVTLTFPFSIQTKKMYEAFRIQELKPDGIESALGRWAFVAVYWDYDGWEPRAAVRFIRQNQQMRQQSFQIEQIEYEVGCLDWPKEADYAELINP